MLKILLSFLLFLSMISCGNGKTVPEMGDIVFQTSTSSQSAAIEEASNSKYTHTGIIIMQNNKPVVLEAGNRVRFTDFNSWISSGKGKNYRIKRLKNSGKILTSQVQLEMFKVINNYLGKGYDSRFEWSDDALYCSELVWKVFSIGADVQLCPLKKFDDYNLDGKLMKDLISKRYGGIINKNEKAVAPVDIFNSDLLYDIKY
ncbi:MAG: peptidoglycan peptidase [Spirochaetes bacterium]|nr:peptidoglycan peptidase [Spirochaetota bacterium]